MKRVLIGLLVITSISNANYLTDGLKASRAGNYIKAKELFEKSCNKGNNGGCHNLGILYLSGNGVKEDKNKAKKLFKKACDNGRIGACEYYKRIY